MGDRSDRQYKNGLIPHEWKPKRVDFTPRNGHYYSDKDKALVATVKKVEGQLCKCQSAHDMITRFSSSVVSDEYGAQKIRLQPNDDISTLQLTEISTTINAMLTGKLEKVPVKINQKVKTHYQLSITDFVKVLRVASALSPELENGVSDIKSKARAVTGGNSTDTHEALTAHIAEFSKNVSEDYQRGNPERLPNLIEPLPADVRALVNDYLSKDIGTKEPGFSRGNNS